MQEEQWQGVLLARSRTDANRHQIMEMIAVNKIKQ